MLDLRKSGTRQEQLPKHRHAMLRPMPLLRPLLEDGLDLSPVQAARSLQPKESTPDGDHGKIDREERAAGVRHLEQQDEQDEKQKHPGNQGGDRRKY